MPLGQRLAPKPRETLDFSREASFSREELAGCPRVAPPP
jgi:hypothetical protein